MKIVSLLPSATEIICSLGLRDQLVGVTHECDYPADVAQLPKVTRTLIPHDASSLEIDRLVREQLTTQRALYKLDDDMLERLQPDLIVTQALCDVCAVAEAEVNTAACSLRSNPRVINLEPENLTQVFQCIEHVAGATGRSAQGTALLDDLQQRVQAVAERSKGKTPVKAMLLEWVEPPFTSGHWNPELMRLAGGRDVLADPGPAVDPAGKPSFGRSRQTSWQEISTANPEVMIVSCCGFTPARAQQDVDAMQTNPIWNDLTCVKSNRVHVVDGSAYFSRPGPRLVDSLEILEQVLHATSSK